MNKNKTKRNQIAGKLAMNLELCLFWMSLCFLILREAGVSTCLHLQAHTSHVSETKKVPASVEFCLRSQLPLCQPNFSSLFALNDHIFKVKHQYVSGRQKCLCETTGQAILNLSCFRKSWILDHYIHDFCSNICT